MWWGIGTFLVDDIAAAAAAAMAVTMPTEVKTLENDLWNEVWPSMKSILGQTVLQSTSMSVHNSSFCR